MPPTSASEAADLAACRTLLQGGSKSFNTAARLLPRAVRDPAIALYAFCREADDVIDNGTAGLDWLRERLALAYTDRPLDRPTDRAFARTVQRFAIPYALPNALLDGFAWDAQGRRYQDLSALQAYASRVAGTVGAMMAVLMGVRDRPRLAAAIDLGIAMQLSNIARDVGEDARNGRLYLPLDWLQQAGIDPDRLLADPQHTPAIGHVVSRLLRAAEIRYRHANPGIARLPLACRFGIGSAALLYAEIGREVARRRMDSVTGRAVVSRRRKLHVLTCGLPRIAVPFGRLSGQCVPEGEFLIEAAVQTAPALTPWWAINERFLWTLDLFERLEQRKWVGTEASDA